MIFSLEILEKNDDECILILVFIGRKQDCYISCYKKVSRSQAVMPDLMIWKQISLSHDKCCIIAVRVFISLEIILTLGA
jgi:hypothetical protein